VALAGGVNPILSNKTWERYALTEALSAEGRCRTFDARASGTVRGEGCGLVVLKYCRELIQGWVRVGL
jgi:acyl transferase domain-containing protein